MPQDFDDVAVCDSFARFAFLKHLGATLTHSEYRAVTGGMEKPIAARHGTMIRHPPAVVSTSDQ